MSSSFSKSLRILRYRLLSHILFGERKRRYKIKYKALKYGDKKVEPRIRITDLSNEEIEIYNLLTQIQKQKRG